MSSERQIDTTVHRKERKKLSVSEQRNVIDTCLQKDRQIQMSIEKQHKFSVSEHRMLQIHVFRKIDRYNCPQKNNKNYLSQRIECYRYMSSERNIDTTVHRKTTKNICLRVQKVIDTCLLKDRQLQLSIEKKIRKKIIRQFI